MHLCSISTAKLGNIFNIIIILAKKSGNTPDLLSLFLGRKYSTNLKTANFRSFLFSLLCVIEHSVKMIAAPRLSNRFRDCFAAARCRIFKWSEIHLPSRILNFSSLPSKWYVVILWRNKWCCYITTIYHNSHHISLCIHFSLYCILKIYTVPRQ